MDELNIIKQNEKLINDWNERLNTTEKIQQQLNSFIRIIDGIRKELPNRNSIVPCNGYILSKILQMQGENFQFTRPEFTKSYFDVRKSDNNHIHIFFIKNNREREELHFNIKIMEAK